MSNEAWEVVRLVNIAAQWFFIGSLATLALLNFVRLRQFEKQIDEYRKLVNEFRAKSGLSDFEKA